MQKIIYSTDEVAKLLTVTKTTIKRWADDGIIQCERTPGHHRKFNADNIMDFAVKNNYQLERVRKQLLPLDNISVVKKLAVENDGNFLCSVVMSSSLKGQKNEIVNILYTLHTDFIPYSQIVCGLLFPVIVKLERLLLTNKIDERGFRVAKNTIVNALIALGKKIQPVKRKTSIVAIFSFDRSLNKELLILESKLEVDGYIVFNVGIQNSWENIYQNIERNSAGTILCLVKQDQNQPMYEKEYIALERIAEEQALLFLCGTIHNFVEMDLEKVGIEDRSHERFIEQ